MIVGANSSSKIATDTLSGWTTPELAGAVAEISTVTFSPMASKVSFGAAARVTEPELFRSPAGMVSEILYTPSSSPNSYSSLEGTDTSNVTGAGGSRDLSISTQMSALDGPASKIVLRSTTR